MRLARCDINTCKTEIDITKVKTAILLNKKYDFCDLCFESLKAFIQIRLSGGVDQNSLDGSITVSPFTISSGGQSIKINNTPGYVEQPPIVLSPGLPSATFKWNPPNTDGVQWPSGVNIPSISYGLNTPNVPFDQILTEIKDLMTIIPEPTMAYVDTDTPTDPPTQTC